MASTTETTTDTEITKSHKLVDHDNLNDTQVGEVVIARLSSGRSALCPVVARRPRKTSKWAITPNVNLVVRFPNGETTEFNKDGNIAGRENFSMFRLIPYSAARWASVQDRESEAVRAMQTQENISQRVSALSVKMGTFSYDFRRRLENNPKLLSGIEALVLALD